MTVRQERKGGDSDRDWEVISGKQKAADSGIWMEKGG